MGKPMYAVERELDAADDAKEQAQAIVDTREAELWADPEMISQACQDLDCLAVRDERRFASGFGYPAVVTGIPMMEAIRNGDECEAGRILIAEVRAKIREEAEGEA